MESFNKKIELFRYKAVFTLLEEIRRKFMKTLANRFKVAKSWSSHVISIVKMFITKIELESRGCIVNHAHKGVFEILDANTTFTVNRAKHYSDCMV